MTSARRGTATKDRAVARILGAAGLFGTYLVLVGKASGDEVVAGLVAALLAAVAAALVAGELPIIVPRIRWVGLLLWRLPASAVRESFVVLGASLRGLVSGRPVEGEFLAVPFDVGGDDPESEARRALVVAGASLPPNAVVVAIDRDRGLLLLHRLVGGGPPPGKGDREWPL